MSGRRSLLGLLRKVAISLAIVVVLLACVAGSIVWKAMDARRDGAEEADPALQTLAGPEPAALRGIAKSVNQFSRLHEATAVAQRAGYHCGPALGRLRKTLQAGAPGRLELECGPGEDPAGPGDKVLVLGVQLPQQRAVSLELRKLPGKRWFGGGVDPGGVLASAKGIEFDGPARFVDLVLDAYGGGMSPGCVSPSSCAEVRATRAKDGPRRWDGQPVKLGPRDQIVQRVQQLGLQCAGVRFAETRDASADPPPPLQRCATSSFTGQAQTLDLVLDPMSSAVTALEASVGGKTMRVPVKGSIPEQPPGGMRLLAATASGDVLEFPLAPAFYYQGSDRLKRFGELGEGARSLVVRTNLQQVADMLAAGPAVPVPQLQRLDAAAALLARFGEAGVEPLRTALADAPLPLAAAIALASCEARRQTLDCLATAAVTRPELVLHLASAVKEVQESTQGLAEDHVVKRRLKLLAAQLETGQDRPSARSR